MRNQTPIAIVGMACRLPGASDLESYWRLLTSGASGIGQMPADRLDRRLHFDPSGQRLGTSYTELAGVVEPVAYDPRECPLPEALAATCDPTHLTFCHVACQAARSAGWDPHSIPMRRGGVYVGHNRGTVVSGQLIYGTLVQHAAEYLRECPSISNGDVSPDELSWLIQDITARVRREMPAREQDGSPHLDAHYVASLVTTAFGWDGPAMAVNAACASSLIAMSMGISALQRGDIDCAVVGGASHCKVDSLVLFSKAQSASATGSRPFDDDADGLVAAEGYVALILKTLSAAQRDGDPIWAVIRGVGVSSDGKGKSLWAPRKEGQIEAIRRAYPADLQPDAVQYIEAHATSTQVGDATELAALEDVFGPLRRGKSKLPIGSAKGNVGHTLETAGMAGLVKAVLAMRHGLIPPAVNLRKLNTKVQWDEMGLEVAREPRPWPDDHPANTSQSPVRCAAVNAFGIGGLNVHVVLQSEPTTTTSAEQFPRILDEHRDQPSGSIAIIGAAPIMPGALSLDQLRQLNSSDQTKIASVSPSRWRADLALDPHHRRAHHAVSDQGGQVAGWEYDWRRHRVPPKQIEAADPLQFMLLDCVEAALTSAGLPNDRWDRERAAVMIGTDFLGDFSAELQLAVRLPHLLDTLRQALAARGTCPAQVEQLCGEFEQAFLAHNKTLLDETGSFTTSTLASRITKTFDLMGGAAAIDAGDASSGALLKVAVDWLACGRCDTIICAAGQRALGLFNYERLSLLGRLLGTDGTGFLHPGEGAGVVILRRLEDAQRDHNPILAVIDAIETTRSDEPAVATPLQQRIGHLGGAAGMAEVLANVAVDEANRLAATTIHGGGEQCYRVHWQGSNQSAKQPATPSVAVTSNDVPVAMTPAPQHATALPTSGPVCIRLSAESWHALAPLCLAVADNIAAQWVSLEDQTYQPGHDVRLVLIAKSPEDAAEKLRVAAGRVETPQSRAQLAARGILCHRVGYNQPRVAWMFSGQGSQYSNMLRDLTAVDPAARATVDRIDRAFSRLGMSTWTEMAWDDADGLGNDVLRTKLAVLGADWLLADQLTRHGISPTIVGGHSFGEYAALAQANVWSWEDAVQAGRARARAVVDHCGSDGAMICTDADAQTVEQLCRTARERSGRGVFLANHNAPRQSVIGGETEALKLVSELLDSEGYRVITIPVPRPYHTPLMQSTRAPLGADLAVIQMRPAITPVLSSVTNRYEADPQAFRENLIQQMVTPVRYVDLVNRLRDDGIDLIIEVGPNQVLTKLHRQILGGEGPLVIPTDDRREGSITATKLAIAAYELLQPTSASQSNQRPTLTTIEPQLTPQLAVTAPEPQLPTKVVFSADAYAHLDIVELAGTPWEMGLEHGRRNGAALRETAERIADAVEWPGGSLRCLSELADHPERLFGSEDLEELAGIAAGAGIDPRTVIACNLYAYPDLSGLGGCSHLVVKDPQGRTIHGANEDLPLSLMVEPFRRRTVQWRRPLNGLDHITFSAAGQLGGIVGMNVAGLAVSSAMLLDRPRQPDAPWGYLHGVLVRRLLGRCKSIAEALAFLQSDEATPRGSGGWALMLTDRETDQALLFEYDGDESAWQQGVDLFATNHGQLLEPRQAIPTHSQHRHSRLGSLLQSRSQQSHSIEQARAALRDRFDNRVGRDAAHLTMNTVCRLDNQLSCVMRPATGELWVHAPGKVTDDGYVRLVITPDASGPEQPAKFQTIAMPTTSALQHAPANATSKWLTTTEYQQAIENYQPPATRVCDRFVVRAVSSSAPTQSSTTSHATIGCVVGSDEFAKELATQLDAQHETQWSQLTLQQLPAFVEQHTANAALQIIFAEQAVGTQSLGTYFDIVRQTIEHAQQSPAVAQWTLLTLSQLGGDFGLSATPTSTGDSLAGLWKAIAMEYRAEQTAAPRMRALDIAPQLAIKTVASKVIELLRSDDRNVEWCLDASGKWGQTRIIPSSLATRENHPVTPSCWIVTGGGRGVTALAAERLAKELKVTVHLLGSTELDIEPNWLDLDQAGLESLKKSILTQAAKAGIRPPINAWKRVESMLEIARNLRHLQQQGVDANYHACDLRDPNAVSQCVANIRSLGKPIVGVIHGAGFEKSSRFSRKQTDDVKRTLEVKLLGLESLFSATQQDPLRHFVCFGSTAGRFGSVGQTDYALANDAMARRMSRLNASRPQCQHACIHWTAWGDVGMAMRPEVLATLKGRGIALMPAAEGIDHLMAELGSQTIEPEVVVTDAERFKQLVAGDALLTNSHLDESQPTPKTATSPEAVPQPVPSGQTQTLTTRSTPRVPAEQRVTGRYVMRLADVDARGTSSTISADGRLQRVLMWGDALWCSAISAELNQRGADCYVVEWDDDIDAMRASFQRYAQEGIIDSFLAIAPEENQHDSAAAERLISLVQMWVSHLDTSSAKHAPVTFATLAPLGGDAGMGGNFSVAASFAGLAGLVKSMVVELHTRGYQQAICHAFDAEKNEPDGQLVNTFLTSVVRPDHVLEGVLQSTQTTARRLAYQRSEFSAVSVDANLFPSGEWIVTGGGRGITCEVAIEVARRFGLKLHLLGSSDLSVVPTNWFEMDDADKEQYKRLVLAEARQQNSGEPPIKAWQRVLAAADVAANLQRFTTAGVQADYHCCDLTDRQAAFDLIDKLRHQGSKITGLMHGAGFEKSADLLKKSSSDIRRTFSIKLDAYEALLDALRDQPLKHVVAFGSISGRLGGLGQVDYCWANDAVAKRTAKLRHASGGTTLATTFDWHSWDGVGMAVRPETRQIKEKMGMTYMSVPEGVDRVIGELESGLPEVEVLITTPEHLARMGQRDETVNTTITHQREHHLRPLVAPAPEATAGKAIRYTLKLRPDRDPFLIQHRFKDRPLLPLVIGIEAMLQASASHAAEGHGWSLSQIEVHGPLRFPNDQPVDAIVELNAEQGVYAASLQSYFRNAAGQVSPKPRVHFTAQIETSTTPGTTEFEGRLCESELIGLRDVAIRDDLVLYHGPIFRMVRKIAIHGDQAVAAIDVPSVADVAGEDRAATGWLSSPAVLDACLFAAGIQLYVAHEGAVSVPMGIERLEFLRDCPVGETVWLRVINRTVQQNEGRFDFALLDSQGHTLLRAWGYRAAIVSRSTPTAEVKP